MGVFGSEALYTPGGRLALITKPDATVISCSYDRQGRLIQKGSGEFLYDELDRLIPRIFPHLI